jgi:hypothetical protein
MRDIPAPLPAEAEELAALEAALAGASAPAGQEDVHALALLVRDIRPATPPAAAARLDARLGPALAGSARPRTRRRRWADLRITLPALGLAAAAAVAVLVVLGGGDGRPGAGRPVAGQEQAAGGGSAAASSAAAATDRAAAPDADALSSVAPAVPPAAADGSPRTDAKAERADERTATITLAAAPRDIDAVAARIQDVARRQGGFVVTSSVTSGGSEGGGSFELRVPADHLDPTMAALAALGHVRSRAQASEDITAATVSAQDRLADARAEVTSLRRRLAAATTTADADSLRARLHRAEDRLARARTRVARIHNRAAYSTVDVELVAERGLTGAAPTAGDGGWRPADALRTAGRILEVVAAVALVAGAVLIPVALLAGLAAGTLRWGGRRRRRRLLDGDA